MSSGETIEVLFWPYPDRVDKQVMNDLVENNSISKKKFKDLSIAVEVESILNEFEDAGYVTSGMVVHPSDGVPYKTWTVTAFFQSRIQWQRDIVADEDVIKMALWNQRNQLLSLHKAKLLKTLGAVSRIDREESTMMDKIQPELREFRRKLSEELAEKRRLKRLQQEEDQEDQESSNPQ